MSDDLQSNVTADVNSAVAGLAKIKAGYAAIGVEIRKVNAYSQDFQNHIARSGNHKTMREASKVIGKLDGGLGHGFKEAFGELGESSTFGRLAVLAGVAGTGIRTFTEILGKFQERSEAGAASLERMNKAMEAADAVTKSRADKGLSEAETRRGLLAVGGQEAVDQADLIGRSGLASPEEAARGVMSIYSKRGGNPKIARQAVDLARGAAARGVPFGAAADEAAGIPGELDGAQSQMVMARMFQKHFNRLGPISTKTTDNAMLAIANDPLAMLGQTANTSGQAIKESDRGKAIEHGGKLLAERANEALNPVEAAKSKEFADQSASMEGLTEQLKRLTDTLHESKKTSAFNADGSPLAQGPGANFLSRNIGEWVTWAQIKLLEQKIYRLEQANADGAFGSTRKSIYRPKEHE